MDKKKKLLEKYLEKKKKQQTRDQILAQIAEFSRSKPENEYIIKFKPASLKSKKTKLKEDSFEKKLFEDDNIEKVLDEEFNIQLLQKNENIEENKIKTEINKNDRSKLYEHANNEPDLLIDITKKDLIKNEFDKIINNPENDSINNMIPVLDANHILPVKDESNSNQNIKNILLNEKFNKIYFVNRKDVIIQQREKLNIFYEQDDIISRIKRNLVTIIRGETGCGKTTQIPQYLLEHGFAKRGKIALTQPRRLSAISISERINIELNENLAGYKIRYENNITENTKIKIMTDGVLLQELKSDFLLSEYDLIIIDEIHERSANIDILMGLLSKIILLRIKTPNPLRLIMMSATIEIENFKNIFSDFELISLNANSFKVSVFYENQTKENYLEQILGKITSILESPIQHNRKKKNKEFTDNLPFEIENNENSAILVFLPCKDDIYALKNSLDALNQDIIVLPLHSSLSKSEQSCVYKKYDQRKVILSTNIAETSITIDDVVFVIDSGRCKYKLRNLNSVVYRIDFISKSSAKQRSGRAGRIKAGVCFRMYDPETFDQFHEFDTPQILIEPLDNIFLQLKSLGIKNMFLFPFVTPPPIQAIKDSISSLQNIGALDSQGDITDLGYSLSIFPIEPRIAKIMCLKDIEDISYEMAIIASMLSLGFEIKKTENNKIIFENQSSDLIVYLRIFLLWLKTGKIIKGINSNILGEIDKLSKYLLKLAKYNLPNKFTELDENKVTKISKNLFYIFSDHLAIYNGDSYSYNDMKLYISRDSIEVTSQFIIFDHIIIGKNKAYAKHITSVNYELF